jgi:hypothetical protein
MIRTTIRSPRQDAIEPHKPAFVFYFEDAPQYVARDARGRLAHMLKSYRRHPERHRVVKAGTHAYRVFTVNSAAVARIEAI